MNILLVNTYHFPGGGDSTYTFNLADLLRSQGHRVAFFAMQDERNLPDVNADLFVSHIDFRELNEHRDPARALRVLGRSIYSAEARRQFSRMLDRVVPDVVHMGNIHAHISPSVIFEAKKRGLPVVWTLHDFKLICPNSHFRVDATGEVCEACGKAAYYRPLLKRCKKGSLLASSVAALEAYAHKWMRVRSKVDAFVAASIFLRNKLIERGLPPERLHHLPYFVPPEMFNSSDTNEGYFLFVGRIELFKGIRPLLEACRLAADARLRLVGRLAESLESKLPGWLPFNAEYAGVVSALELRRLLRGALAVVLPSLVYESQPFSILEAFACGKPVIASDLGGMVELVKDGERGLLVPPGDVEALAEAMRWMTAHPVEAREMGDSAQRYTRREHNAERHYEELMRVYAQAR